MGRGERDRERISNVTSGHSSLIKVIKLLSDFYRPIENSFVRNRILITFQKEESSFYPQGLHRHFRNIHVNFLVASLWCCVQ